MAEERSVKQFNVYLSTDVIRALKHHAADTERSLSSIVEVALREYLERSATGSTPTRGQKNREQSKEHR